jgi:hypothetical protein
MAFFCYLVGSMRRHGVRTVVKVTGQINISTIDSLQVFCHFNRKTGSCYVDQSHYTNERFYVILFNYFVTLIEKQGVGIKIELT